MSRADNHHILDEVLGTGAEDSRTWHFLPSWNPGIVVTVREAGNDGSAELVRWYLDEHAANDPLNCSKAKRAEDELARQSRLLCDALPPFGQGAGTMLLDIAAKNMESTCYSIPWELLENSRFAAGRRLIVRRRTPPNDRQAAHLGRLLKTFNIAIIAARVGRQDHDY